MQATTAIPMSQVQSSNIAAIGYDEATQTLAVQFKTGKGAVYHYVGVTPKTHADLMAAPSIGSFVNKNIVGKFEHTKIVPEEKAEEKTDGVAQ
jgi:hypothetical protein